VLREGDRETWREPAERRANAVIRLFGKSRSGVLAVTTAFSDQDKCRLFKACHTQGMEGVVMKHKHHAYHAGRNDDYAIKYKFVNTASVIVKGRHGDKNSIEIMLHDGRDLGSVTMIGKTIPPAGTVVEVKYLYVHDVGGKMIQPVFLRVRDDIEPEECTAEQLHIKGTAR
jgi:ATP-dependent DNA ligase